MKKRLLLLMVALLISGCALAPGMRMESTEGFANVEVPVPGKDGSVTTKVPITPISASLILKQSRKTLDKKDTGNVDPLPSETYQPYRIGPRDILSITVWDRPDLIIPSGEFHSDEAAGYVVGEDGTLFYPYVGVLDVAGMTVPEVRDLLTRRLSRSIENPQLDVRVAVYRSQKVYIVGEVKQPGIQPITDVPLTVTDAINRSGGVTEEADLANITLSRNGQVYKIDLLALYQKGDLSQNLLLKNADVLNIPDRNQNKVFVLGEVFKPSSRVMVKSRMSLAEALGDAGGVDPTSSNPARIYVIRGGTPTPEIFRLDASSPDALLLADRFRLEPRDVVYVDTAGVTRWNRVIRQILPTTQSLRQTTQFP